ncbi:8125_t:CDS:2, partial [Acaulospora morrowiae]
KILEINPYHPLILGFWDKVENDKADDAMKEMVEVLYIATLIRSGYMLENTQKFASLIEKVLRHNLGVDPNAEAVIDITPLADDDKVKEKNSKDLFDELDDESTDPTKPQFNDEKNDSDDKKNGDDEKKEETKPNREEL